jgi:hypothetical protein
MITLAQAKDKIVREEFRSCEYAAECPVRIEDQSTEEHDWGWIIYVRSYGPEKENKPFCSVFLVDRMYGMIGSIAGSPMISINDFKQRIAARNQEEGRNNR